MKLYNINTAVAKHVSSENIAMFKFCFKWWSTINLFLNHKKIEIIKEVVLPQASNLEDTMIKKKQGNQIQFSPEKRLEKKHIHHCYCHTTISPQLMNYNIK